MKRKQSHALSLMKPLLVASLFTLVSPAVAQFHKRVNLVSDISGTAAITDALLVNPWGMSFSATSPFWVSDAGTNKVTLYSVNGMTGAVSKVALEVNTPGPPSGQVFNGSSEFVISGGGKSGAARFIFAGLNGTISGWNPAVPPPVAPATVSTQAVPAATGTPPPVAYTGLASGTLGADQFLYAANNAGGRIDVFDKDFAQVSLAGSFTDPDLPAGDKPFNVSNIGGDLYVTYSGPTGIVNVFDTEGHFIKRFATGGTLLSPWGIAIAPANFGKFSHALLIGNFNSGDPAVGPGWISAFDPSTGSFLGLLEDTSGNPISIDGLWTLTFGNGGNGGIRNLLYLSAGIQKQTHGLLASLASCGPTISGASATPHILWPPNHKMVPVTVDFTVADYCDPSPVCSLSISSNEGAGGGSGHTSPDWQILNAHEVELRAERAGRGDGRIYTITIDCKDSLNLSDTSTVTVSVPHNGGK